MATKLAPSHRTLIFSTTAVVVAYSLAVLAFVTQIPQIGVNCSFRLDVNRVSPDYIRGPDGRENPTVMNLHVSSLAGKPVETWVDWNRSVRDLDSLEYPRSESWNPDGVTFTDNNRQRWVKVALKHGDQSSEVWCRVGRIPPSDLLPSIIWFFCETGLLVIALLVYWKRPNERAARLFFLQSIVVIGAYMGGYHWARISTQPALTTIYIICAVLLPATNLHLFLHFAGSRQLGRHPTRTLVMVYGVPIIFAGAMLLGYGGVRWLVNNGTAPAQVNRAMEWMRGLIFAYIGVASVWYFISVLVLAKGYWLARDVAERNQLRLILFGSIAALIPIGYSLYMANWHPVEFGGGAAIWPMFIASTCFTATYAVAITRYRLLQFDQLLNSGLVYVMVSFFAAVVYCVLVLTGMLLFGTRGPSLDQALWVSGSALVLSIGMDAARTRLRQFLDKRFRRDKTQLDLILERLGGAVGQLVDLPTLANRLLTVSADLHGFTRGTVFIWDETIRQFRLAGTLGGDWSPAQLAQDGPLATLLRERGILERTSLPPLHPARLEMFTNAGDVAVGLSHEDRLIGMLLLARPPGVGPRHDDARLLSAFAPIAALALAGAEVRHMVESLNRELQSKVEKISEQQRRILSLQQQLVNQSRRVPAATIADEDSTGESPPASNVALSGLVGSGPALQQVLEMLPKVAANFTAALIRGESGTGKELVAKGLHDLSPRASGPFVKVHCAALAPGILESELFGHVKGSFTGATRDKPGRFETANGGTIFLDEIGDINPEVQTKLLRVLQEKTFERVGSNDPIRVDVRLITATHQDLERLIREGKFRSDLYYRLNVITLQMPALRERGEDIIELAHHFLRGHAERCKKVIDGIDDDALLAMRFYHWPGNIRELENAIERAVLVAEKPTLTLDDLPAEFRQAPASVDESERPIIRLSRSSPTVHTARAARHAREREELVRVLERVGWNRSDAARELGLARSTLLSRMKKFGLMSGKS